MLCVRQLTVNIPKEAGLYNDSPMSSLQSNVLHVSLHLHPFFLGFLLVLYGAYSPRLAAPPLPLPTPSLSLAGCRGHLGHPYLQPPAIVVVPHARL